MKNSPTIGCITMLGFGLTTAFAAQDAPILRDEKAKYSYAVGVELGKKLKTAPLELDVELVSRGLRDALTGERILLTETELKAAQAALQEDVRKKQAEIAQQLADKNKQDGEAFLAENKAKEGVVTLQSGLQYKILKAGDGKKPTAEDTVVCNYRGTLLDGTEFDSSYQRNRPGTFSLKSVIKGWSEALQLMPVGSKWQLFIPSALAYGEKGPVGKGRMKIGPNATLLFEVELIAIQDAVAGGAHTTAAKGVSGIQVSFKLDPRLTQGLYMGERWVSPPTYTTTLETIEARAEALDGSGSPGNAAVKWTSSDPEVVTVSPAEGNVVKIAVKRPGQITLRLSSDGASKELSVKAANHNNIMQVEITQPQ